VSDEDNPCERDKDGGCRGEGIKGRGDGNAERQRHRLNSRTPSSPSYSRPSPVTGESRDRERPEEKRTDGRADGRTVLSQSVSQSVGKSRGARGEPPPPPDTYTHIHSHTNTYTRVHTLHRYNIYSLYERKSRQVRFPVRKGLLDHPLERTQKTKREGLARIVRPR